MGSRSLTSTGIFRKLCRLGVVASGRRCLCRQLRLLKPLLPPALCCSLSPTATGSPGINPKPAPAKTSPGCPNPSEEQSFPRDAPQPPACSTSVSWPQAMGSPWQPLLRSSSLMPGRSSHGCVFQGSRAEMGMERDGKGSELCPAPHASAGCGSKVLTHCLTLVLASVLRE